MKWLKPVNKDYFSKQLHKIICWHVGDLVIVKSSGNPGRIDAVDHMTVSMIDAHGVRMKIWVFKERRHIWMTPSAVEKMIRQERHVQDW